MSTRQALRQLRALAEDETLGLGARMVALAVDAAMPIETRVHVMKWRLAGQPLANGGINVAIRPRTWTTTESAGGVREGVFTAELLFECFSSDPDEIDETLAVGSVAVVQLVDALRGFSDANSGDIVGLADAGIVFRYGDFDGPTASGFTASIPLQELGTE